jgi:hypothetical protein
MFFSIASNFTKTDTKIEDTIETKTTKKVRWYFSYFLSIEKFLSFSRTLTAVHDAILHDLVYPAEITGKRIRIKLDGSRLFKVHLDKNQQTLVENKVDFVVMCHFKPSFYFRFQLFNQFIKNLLEKMFILNFQKCSFKPQNKKPKRRNVNNDQKKIVVCFVVH